jgi:hypothetical protein
MRVQIYWLFLKIKARRQKKNEKNPKNTLDLMKRIGNEVDITFTVF